MAEIERIANHIGDFGAIANDASFAFLLARAGVASRGDAARRRRRVRPPADDGRA